VYIDSQPFYLGMGEYADGRLGEIWIDANKAGSFANGILGTVARTASVLLQNGCDICEVVHSFRELNFPPRGLVEGSRNVAQCTSLPDWIAQEIEAEYGQQNAVQAAAERPRSLGFAGIRMDPALVERMREMHGTTRLGLADVSADTPDPTQALEGYTGDVCEVCHSLRMVRTGKCATCQDCGSTGGCS
jgi:ribonucleoside-diphosphate reductase alpha chain